MKNRSFILSLIALITCIIGIGYICYMLYDMVKNQSPYINMTLVSFFTLGCFVGVGIMFIGGMKNDKNCS